MVPDPESVMESVEQNYDFECKLTTDESVQSVDVNVDFIVTEVPPEIARDIAKFVSVRGYQAYLGEVQDKQSGNIPVSKTGESE